MTAGSERAPMTGAEAVVRVLVEQGVEVVFGIPGGAVLPLYDALYGAPIRHVLARHEQGAALAADGYARASGRVGVCIATSGPGATNLITGLATSYLDSVPVVAVTGNVGRAFLGTDAFQEADTFGVSMPVTKHNYLVLDPEELPAVLREAFAVAASGRPGPVLVDIPKDVFTATISPRAWDRPLRRSVSCFGHSAADSGTGLARPTPPGRWHPRPHDAERLEEAARLIARARRPVLYAGGGVIVAGAAEALRQLAEGAVLPTTTTLMALGAMPGDHPLFLGMPGMHGTYAANMALTETDCLIAVGARFDDRVTGRVSDFAPEAAIIHIDVDAAELGKVKAPRVAIAAGARQGLEALREALGRVRPDEWSDRSPWLERVNGWKQEHPYRYDRDLARRELLPQAVIEELERATGGDALVVTGVGQHQMWAAMFYRYRWPRQFLTSGGLGTMGYGLPAALGAQLARPDARVLCIDGDGSFQMNVQELSTLAELGLPVKVFIINNRAHGMVRQWQDLFYGQRLSASVFEHQPDFVKLAEAYGVAAYRITHPDELAGTVREALARPGPVVVDCVVRQEEHVLPMVPPGAALKEMIVG
ncbi:acetolactate synthase, large subunit [Thermaerobacter subterraneus DSM 13965]|uniref:Acetolactate synthase n=2 Tax=Thermaerobacter TaxID=73918 RepID=K6QEN1_9FIRM|nr:acetolactate synthase, large subunit [Thermaerobacter subterraneus DSM 13965]